MRFYHFIFIWHKFSCVLPSNIVRFISFFSICWHDFMFINVFGFNMFLLYFQMLWETETERERRRRNENWNVLCIKAQFQMDYYLFNTTRKKRFYDSIHEFCVLSSPANLKFHTDHKNIEKSKRCVCEFYVSNITIGFGINYYGKFCSYSIIRFRVYPWLNIYRDTICYKNIYWLFVYSQLLILFMHKHNFMYLYERVLNITNISQ